MSAACIAKGNNLDVVAVCIPLTENQGSLSEGNSMFKLFHRMRKTWLEEVLWRLNLFCFYLNDSDAQFVSTTALFFACDVKVGFLEFFLFFF